MEPIKIFVVDDSVVARGMLIRQLSGQQDMEIVGEAGSGQGCVIMLDEVNPDIVLLEASIGGGMQLSEVIREIKKMQPEVQVILCTDPFSTSHDTVLPSAELGAFDFITKPYRSGTLLRVIREAYAARQRMRQTGEL